MARAVVAGRRDGTRTGDGPVWPDRRGRSCPKGPHRRRRRRRRARGCVRCARAQSEALADQLASRAAVAVGDRARRARRRCRGRPGSRRGRPRSRSTSMPISAANRSPWVAAMWVDSSAISRDQVEVRGEVGDRSVEEHQVLHVQHEDLRKAGPHRQQRLDDALDLAERARPGRAWSGRPARGRGRARAITSSMSVSAGRAPRSRNASICVRTSPIAPVEHQPQERGALQWRHPGGDAEVQQRDPARRGDEQVPAVQVAVEDAVDHAALGEAP